MLSVAKHANSDFRDQSGGINEWVPSGSCQPWAWGHCTDGRLVATAEFSKFTGILSAALSQHHLLRFKIAQLEITSTSFVYSDAS